MNNTAQLPPNSLAFIALANEYCQTVENILNFDRNTLVATMLKLLPRLYIVVTDMSDGIGETDAEMQFALDEQTYDHARELMSAVMGEADVYLEVFEEDMKYSDTPIAATVSENLADLYQEFFNLIYSVKDADTEAQMQLLLQCKENFRDYWGQTLCNVLLALHAISCENLNTDNNY